MNRHENMRVIALDVRPRRLGYVVFEGPTRLIDWGVKRFEVEVRHVERIVRLVAVYHPSVILLRNVRKNSSRHTPAFRSVHRRIVNWANSVELPIAYVTEAAVRQTFSASAKATKERIARLIAGCFPELAWHVPPPRKLWQSESRSMPIFDAAALALAYFAKKDPMAVRKFIVESVSFHRPLGGVAR